MAIYEAVKKIRIENGMVILLDNFFKGTLKA